MALVRCSECGMEISDTAKACPKCGYVKRNFMKSAKSAVKMGTSVVTKMTFTRKVCVFIGVSFILFASVLYVFTRLALEPVVAASLIVATGFFLTAAVSMCTFMFNAEQQRIAEFRKFKLIYYNQMLETLYLVSDSEEGQVEPDRNLAERQFTMEKSRLPLYASEEVIGLLNDDVDHTMKDVVSAVRNDLYSNDSRTLRDEKSALDMIDRTAFLKKEA